MATQNNTDNIDKVISMIATLTGTTEEAVIEQIRARGGQPQVAHATKTEADSEPEVTFEGHFEGCQMVECLIASTPYIKADGEPGDSKDHLKYFSMWVGLRDGKLIYPNTPAITSEGLEKDKTFKLKDYYWPTVLVDAAIKGGFPSIIGSDKPNHKHFVEAGKMVARLWTAARKAKSS